MSAERDRRCRAVGSRGHGLGLALGLGVALGCGAEFAPASEITGLRVLAVKKSRPYARPGERVDLTMLWADAETGRPPPQIAWVALCDNPPADLFEACFTQAPELSPDELAARISTPEPGAASANDRFSVVVPRDLISSRPQPPQSSAAPYGLSYVFFAVCAGQLDVDMGSQIPFVCYEELDGSAGFGEGDRRLDSRDFVIGYTAIYAYEAYQNTNPRFVGIEFDGLRYWPDAPPELAASAPEGAVLAPPRDVCIGESCAPPAPGDEAEPCIDGLTLDACVSEDCASAELQALIDPASAEIDQAASARGSETLGEQMWVNYYSTAGELDEEVRLLNDALAGFRNDVSTAYEPTDSPGVSYLWAVAHDNRGGTDWARLRICTR